MLVVDPCQPSPQLRPPHPSPRELEKRIAELEDEVARLRRSEAQYRALVEQASDAIVTAAGDPPRVLSINEAGLAVSGYAREEIVGRTLTELVDSEDLRTYPPAFGQVFAGDTVRNVRRLLRRDGTPVPMETSTKRLEDGRVQIILRDVTEREEAEQALRKRGHDLAERVKELQCLFGLGRLLQDPEAPLPEILQRAAELLPPAQQYPETACARIALGAERATSPGFLESPWRLGAEVHVSGERSGMVEVFYRDERPESDEGPFLKEERFMLEAFADLLAQFAERHRALRELRESSDRLDLALDASNACLWDWRIRENTVVWRGDVTALFGPDVEPPRGLDEVLSFVHPGDRGRVREAVLCAARDGHSYDEEHRAVWRDGTVRFVAARGEAYRNERGETERMIGFSWDVTERKHTEREMHRLAFYDVLTGLPNRRLFEERMDFAVARAARRGRSAALLSFDLDSFKKINDSLGPRAGDTLLRQVARRLVEATRIDDVVVRSGAPSGASIVSRPGGDEFSVLLSELADPGDATGVARRILDALASPFHLDGHEIFLTACIGISLFPEDGEDVEALLRNADTAMYHAKQRGPGSVQFYAPSMNAAAARRLAVEARLHRALDSDSLRLHFQPFRDAATGQVVAAEALLRIEDGEPDPPPPGEFIAVAEQTGLVMTVGAWAIRAACAQGRAWQDAGYEPLRISVNVSAQQFWDPSFVDGVRSILADTGFDPSRLELEITETTIMRNVDETRSALRALRDLGVTVALDDFGTGQSSLATLRLFPLDRLKIDRSFVREIHRDPTSAALAGAILSMAHALHLRVVAEGVETLEQAEILRAGGCDELQGFLISRPVPSERFERFLARSKPLGD